MKLRDVFAGLVCIAFASWASAQSLAWDDPSISDGPCTPRPKAFPLPAALVLALKGAGQGFRFFEPWGSASYYRWVYQKVNAGLPATDQSQILATRPRVTFPSLWALPVGAVGHVDVERQPVDGLYNIRVISVNNPVATDVIVHILNPSNQSGSAPDGFGGWDVPTVNIWADARALVEWHCLVTSDDRKVQVFNILSLDPTLTPSQVSAISTVLIKNGFKPSNFITMPY